MTLLTALSSIANAIKGICGILLLVFVTNNYDMLTTQTIEIPLGSLLMLVSVLVMRM